MTSSIIIDRCLKVTCGQMSDRVVALLYGGDVYWSLTLTYMTVRTSATYTSLTGH